MTGHTVASRLGFNQHAKRAFEFLVSEYAFELRAEEPLWLRFENGSTFIEISHGTMSYEVGVEFGSDVGSPFDGGPQKYSREQIVQTYGLDSDLPKFPSTNSEDVLVRILDRIAESSRGVLREIANNPDSWFFPVYEAGNLGTETWIQEQSASRLRAEADDAWHRRDLHRAVELYSALEALSLVSIRPSERARLEYARKRSST